MHQRIINLYEEYTEGTLDRREFLKKLAILSGGTMVAYTLLSQLETKVAMAEVVPKDDPHIS